VLTLATAYDYDRLIKVLLLPAPIAQKPINQIDDGDINRFLGELMKRKGLNGQLIGPRRINMMIARFRTIFSIAKRRKLIAEDPMVFVKNLREPKGEVDPFTLEEAERLIDTATGQDRAIITVLIFCGLRPNEAFALRWEDVDFDREQLRVRRSIHRFAGIGLPKTASSEREVDMLALVVDELQEQRARSQLRGDLVFLNDTGGPIDLTNFRDRNWKRILVKASLRHRTVYQCRHTYAALQPSRGENPQYVAHQMGHTNLEMIIRHYARWSRRPERVGTLAHQLSAKFPSKKPEISLKMAAAGAPSARGATHRSSQVADSIGRIGGAGDRGRTGDVQLGKLAFYR
jgi:integrase